MPRQALRRDARARARRIGDDGAAVFLGFFTKANERLAQLPDSCITPRRCALQRQPRNATPFADGCKPVPYSREQLDVRFARLEAELKRLDLCQAPEQDRWAAFEYLVHVPASYIDDKDRRWWWEQVYAMMERHGLAELSGVATGSH